MNEAEFLEFLDAAQSMGTDEFKSIFAGIGDGEVGPEDAACEAIEALFYEGPIESFWANAVSVIEKTEHLKSLGFVDEEVMENISCSARVVATPGLHGYFLRGMDAGSNELLIIDLALNKPTYQSEVSQANPDAYMKDALANYWSLCGSEKLDLGRVKERLAVICKNGGYKAAVKKAASEYMDAMAMTVKEKRVLESAVGAAPGSAAKIGL